MSSSALSRSFQIKGQEFSAVHLRLYGSDEPRHQVHYCAHSREVYEENLSKALPDLSGSLVDNEENHFFSATYISSPVLDSAVNNERTDFFLADLDPSLFPEEISREELRNGVVSEIRSALEPYLSALEIEKIERFENYVHRKAPQYRPLLKHGRSFLNSIPASVSEESLDLELHKAKLHYVAELKRESQGYLSGNTSIAPEDGEFRDRYRQFTEQLSDFVKSELAEYIVHRKMVLDLLQKSLDIREDGRYYLEENVHGLIFPLRTTSDDIGYERQNLWIIDERLSYHRYLASDRPLSSLSPLESEGTERPDIVVFNHAFAFVSDDRPFGSIVIIEFKRPLRKDYDDDENPISQVYGYVDRIRAGTTTDRTGRPVAVAENTPFYCYILCDLTPKMRKFSQNATFLLTPDGLGYFGYNPNHKAYVEVISYDKLVGDARKRNQILFDKLHLPSQ
jgi:hypothetical protein